LRKGGRKGISNLSKMPNIFGPRFSLSFRAEIVWGSYWALAAFVGSPFIMKQNDPSQQPNLLAMKQTSHEKEDSKSVSLANTK
jgi:hypothetical protein